MFQRPLVLLYINILLFYFLNFNAFAQTRPIASVFKAPSSFYIQLQQELVTPSNIDGDKGIMDAYFLAPSFLKLVSADGFVEMYFFNETFWLYQKNIFDDFSDDADDTKDTKDKKEQNKKESIAFNCGIAQKKTSIQNPLKIFFEWATEGIMASHELYTIKVEEKEAKTSHVILKIKQDKKEAFKKLGINNINEFFQEIHLIFNRNDKKKKMILEQLKEITLISENGPDNSNHKMRYRVLQTTEKAFKKEFFEFKRPDCASLAP